MCLHRVLQKVELVVLAKRRCAFPLLKLAGSDPAQDRAGGLRTVERNKSDASSSLIVAGFFPLSFLVYFEWNFPLLFIC